MKSGLLKAFRDELRLHVIDGAEDPRHALVQLVLPVMIAEKYSVHVAPAFRAPPF
jgi:hypothetical protein